MASLETVKQGAVSSDEAPEVSKRSEGCFLWEAGLMVVGVARHWSGGEAWAEDHMMDVRLVGVALSEHICENVVESFAGTIEISFQHRANPAQRRNLDQTKRS